MKQVRAIMLQNDKKTPVLDKNGKPIEKVFDLAMWANIQKFPMPPFKFLRYEEEKEIKVADVPVKIVKPSKKVEVKKVIPEVKTVKKKEPITKIVNPVKKEEPTEQPKKEVVKGIYQKDIKELRKMYAKKIGKKPFMGWKVDVLIKKMEL